VAEAVRITPEIAIPVAELEFRASRASGPGGQGVNTTDSRVELRFDLAGSPSLTDEAKELALRRLGPAARPARPGPRRPAGSSPSAAARPPSASGVGPAGPTRTEPTG
jgi:RF-1 domain